MSVRSHICFLILAWGMCFPCVISAGVLQARQESNNLQGNQTIGALVPLTGMLESLGGDVAAGIRKGVIDYNEKLQNNYNAGWLLDLDLKDTNTDPAVALSQLISLLDSNTSLVIGPVASGSLSSTKSQAANGDAILFSPSSVATAHSTPNDGVFRLVPDANIQGEYFVEQLLKDNIDTIILVHRNGTWGQDLSSAIKTYFSRGKDKGVIEKEISYVPGDFDAQRLAQRMNNEVTTLAEERDDLNGVAIVILSYDEITNILVSAEKVATNSTLDLDNLRWYGAASTYPEIISTPEARAFAQTVQYSTIILAIDTSLPIYGPVRAAIQQMVEIEREPDVHGFIAYDAVQILGEAIRRADDTDPAVIAGELPKAAKIYNGFVGNAELNENGDLLSSNYQRWQVIGGEWQRVTSGAMTFASSSVVIMLPAVLMAVFWN